MVFDNSTITEADFIIILSMGIGLLVGIFIGISGAEEADPQLRSADLFCEGHGYDHGYYESGLLGPSDAVAGIHCFSGTGSHLEDTWRVTESADFYVANDYTVVGKSVEGDSE